MRRTVAICGTFLIAAVLIISGSAVAAWYYAVSVDDGADYTDGNEMLGSDDDDHGTLGIDSPLRLGWISLDLGSGNEMGPSQDFTVFANSADSEEYSVHVQDPGKNVPVWLGNNYDLADHDFTTPSTFGKTWRYIILVGESGLDTGDYAYGPDIDAVGWEDP